MKYIDEKKLYEVKPDKTYMKYIFMKNMYYSFFGVIIVAYFYLYMIATSLIKDQTSNIFIISLLIGSLILVIIYACLSVTKREFYNIKYIITNNRIIFEYGIFENKVESFFYEELVDVDVQHNVDDLYTLVFIKKRDNQTKVYKKDILKIRYIKNANRLVEILENNIGGN